MFEITLHKNDTFTQSFTIRQGGDLLDLSVFSSMRLYIQGIANYVTVTPDADQTANTGLCTIQWTTAVTGSTLSANAEFVGMISSNPVTLGGEKDDNFGKVYVLDSLK